MAEKEEDMVTMVTNKSALNRTRQQKLVESRKGWKLKKKKKKNKR